MCVGTHSIVSGSPKPFYMLLSFIVAIVIVIRRNISGGLRGGLLNTLYLKFQISYDKKNGSSDPSGRSQPEVVLFSKISA